MVQVSLNGPRGLNSASEHSSTVGSLEPDTCGYRGSTVFCLLVVYISGHLSELTFFISMISVYVSQASITITKMPDIINLKEERFTLAHSSEISAHGWPVAFQPTGRPLPHS